MAEIKIYNKENQRNKLTLEIIYKNVLDELKTRE